MDHTDNIVYPRIPGATTCGYCSPGQRSEEASSYHTATLDALNLSPSVYQVMIDRGWRRSGTYCYKPNLKVSCCPQYTIKLGAMEFKPSRSQRQLLNRWNRFVLHGDLDKSIGSGKSTDTTVIRQTKPHTPKLPPLTSLADSVHLAESKLHPDLEAAHNFEVVLEPASYTPQKYALYKKYQEEIHNDKMSYPVGFKRFLVESPLHSGPIPYSTTRPDHLPRNYGSYHQLYKLDGQLIALAVLDILPKCVSSVYFIYDKTWERFSMGKLSALREVSLAREIREAGVPSMEALYMGFYIHTCQKMRYKGEYTPSYLADPETYEWYPFQTCVSSLEKYRYACFSNPSHSSNDAVESGAAYEPSEISPTSKQFDDIKIITRNSSGEIITMPIKRSRYISQGSRLVSLELGSCIQGLGLDLAREIYFAI